MKTAAELFDIMTVPDGFVFKFIGSDDDVVDLCCSPGFDIKFAQLKIHTIKRTSMRWKSDNPAKCPHTYNWNMDGWLSWGNSTTCASDMAWANRDALLKLVERKFGKDYEHVMLPKAA